MVAVLLPLHRSIQGRIKIAVVARRQSSLVGISGRNSVLSVVAQGAISWQSFVNLRSTTFVRTRSQPVVFVSRRRHWMRPPEGPLQCPFTRVVEAGRVFQLESRFNLQFFIVYFFKERCVDGWFRISWWCKRHEVSLINQNWTHQTEWTNWIKQQSESTCPVCWLVLDLTCKRSATALPAVMSWWLMSELKKALAVPPFSVTAKIWIGKLGMFSEKAVSVDSEALRLVE